MSFIESRRGSTSEKSKNNDGIVLSPEKAKINKKQDILKPPTKFRYA